MAYGRPVKPVRRFREVRVLAPLSVYLNSLNPEVEVMFLTTGPIRVLDQPFTNMDCSSAYETIRLVYGLPMA